MGKDRILLLGFLITVMLLASCQAETPVGTQVSEAEPTNDPLLASSCQVALIGKWLDEGNVIISIRNTAGAYYMTREYPDRSSETKDLGVRNVDGVVRFFEDGGNMTGAYWIIADNLELVFYEGDKVVKSLPVMASTGR